jgi:hypothetical protein
MSGANVDFGGDGTKVIYDRHGRNPVRLDIWAEYSYHPSGNVSQIRLQHRVADDQTGLDDDDRSKPDPTADVIRQVVSRLKPDFDALAKAARELGTARAAQRARLSR